MKEQNKCDQMLLGLSDRLQRILLFANKVAGEIICEETDLLEKIIPQTFEVMNRVAKFSCNYVRRCRWPSLDLTSADDCSENGWAS